MTNLYFVRHSKIEYTHDDHSRQLSEEGKKSVPRVTKAFKDIQIDQIVSSPYIRAVDTIKGIAETKSMNIRTYDDLRERKVSNVFIDDFQTYTKNQWHDFCFKLEGGESLREVQKRGSSVIDEIVIKNQGQNIVVGTHGTFLAVILKHYDDRIDYEFWRNLKMPDIYKATFDIINDKCEMVSLENIKL